MAFTRFHRWLYQEGHPNLLARVCNRGWAIVRSLGFAADHLVTLRVVARRSCRPISFPLTTTMLDGERCLVSMLGVDASWVRNVGAASGRATLIHGRTDSVRLEEVEVERRLPILKSYLLLAPGARPHLPVDKDAPLEGFAGIAPEFPVFRVLLESDASLDPGRDLGNLDAEPERSPEVYP